MTAKRKSSAKKKLGPVVSKKLTFASASAAAKFVIARGLAAPFVAKNVTAPKLIKTDPASPALKLVGPKLYLVGGTRVAGEKFSRDARILLPTSGLIVGSDYGVSLNRDGFNIEAYTVLSKDHFAGFHFAPGGNAKARTGGDSIPQINPTSLWDSKFMPACGNPASMHLEHYADKAEWLDTYFLGKDHIANGGTSKFGVTIADGNDQPQNPAGGYFAKCDYVSVEAVLKHHGKSMPSYDLLRAAAHGVTEKSSAKTDPKITGLDAERTGHNGMQQATGNMNVWCTDGDPDNPRASLFGGSWLSGESAGSRYASVAYDWPDNSHGNIGARGRSDHLQLG